MQKLVQILAIVVAAVSVGAADALIKRASFGNVNFSQAVKNPLMVVALLLYLPQIVLFAYVFTKKWQLGVVGVLQLVIYAIVVVFIGVVFFQEKITFIHWVGILLAIIAVILMNV